MSLSVEESHRVCEAFFMTLYGVEVHSKWKNLKVKMRFTSEKDFITWMLDYIIGREDLALLDQQQQQQHAGAETYPGAEMMSTEHSTAVKLSAGNVVHVAYQNSEWQNRADLVAAEAASAAEYTPTAAATTMSKPQGTSGTKKIVLVRPDHVSESAAVKEERLFKCNYCDYRAIKQSHLIMHYRTHTDERPFHCLQCSAKFRNRSHLIRHMASVHQKLKAHSCRHCPYTCARPTDLRRHLVHVHNYESNYKCNFCGKSFFAPNQLEKHAVIHDTEQAEAAARAVVVEGQQVGSGQQQQMQQQQVVESGEVIGFDTNQLVQRVIHNTGGM